VRAAARPSFHKWGGDARSPMAVDLNGELKHEESISHMAL